MSELILEKENLLPEGWVELNLDEISLKLNAGGTPSTKIKKYYYNGTIPFVKIDDITNSYRFLDETQVSITKEGLENSSAWIIPKNSILYSMYASYGIPIINRIPVSTSQAIIAYIPPKEGIKLEFVYYFLESIKLNLKPKGTTQKNLNAEIIRNLRIKLPPFNEQKRIVEKIEEVFSLTNNAKEIINKIKSQLKIFEKSILHAALIGTLSQKFLK